MAYTKTLTYPDTLFYDALVKALNEAKEGIEVVTFVFKTNYAQHTRSDDVAEALKAAAGRGVPVYVVLNYSQYEPDVCIENYRTGQALAAAGCQVRMGPRNTTVHAKIAVVDYVRVFVGSHNITRGALTFNREFTVYTRTLEMARRATAYFNTIWANSTPLANVPPPTGVGGAVSLALEGVAAEGAAVALTFSVNHTQGVEAFAAVADTRLNLSGARVGPTVAPTLRTASVTPDAQPGATIYVAVRAYRAGEGIATSNILQMVYEPAEAPPAPEPPPEPPSPPEPPPPSPPPAPNLTSVGQATATTVTLTWAFAGVQNFSRFVLQQRDLEGNWRQLAVLQDSSAREWTGAPHTMDTVNPFRVVVFNMEEQSATSNQVTLTAMQPLVAPVLTVVETVTLEQIHVEWTYATPEDFSRFEIQQRVDEATWQAIATVTEPAARSWNGPAPIMDQVHPVRIVVFNTAEQSAASNEMPIVLTVFAPPVPPVIVSITPYEAGVRVVWTWEDSGRFSHFVVQQRDEALVWHDLATVRGPSDREWIGQPLDMSTTHPYRVWVYNITGESAVSEEGFLTMG